MDGDSRREQIINLLTTSAAPLSGAALAKHMKVSRQVIVQDIALLRANNKNILSTNKGYILYEQKSDKLKKRIVAVRHSDDQIRDELTTIVDAGGQVMDVIIEHDVYGQIAVDLCIASRIDVADFCEKLVKEKAKPLKELTGDIHYHTIGAFEEKTLDQIEEQLKMKGYLIF